MKKIIRKIVEVHGGQLLMLGVALSTLASSSCRFVWQEPEEPDGVRELAKENK